MEKCLWSLWHGPGGWDWLIFWTSKDITCKSRWQWSVGAGSMSGCFLFKAILKMERFLLLFYHHLAKGTDAIFGMISLSGYCSINVSTNFGCIFFLLSCLLGLLNLTNSQKQTRGMKGRAILPLIFQDFSILLLYVHSLGFSMKPVLQMKTGCLKAETLRWYISKWHVEC